MKNGVAFCVGFLFLGVSQAQVVASVPYTPSWAVRHHLQWLIDHAGLQLTGSHWPLPLAAVERALSDLRVDDADPSLERSQITWAVDAAKRELAQKRGESSVGVHARNRSEGLTGFGENYTPGSSLTVSSREWRAGSQEVSAALALGLRLEESPNSLQTNFSGFGTEGRYQLRLDETAAVVGWGGWNAQAFSHRHAWGPGWQSSLVNGHNNAPWTGLGLQRGSVAASETPWLSWMGPWNFDVFVAKAQDPLVVANQPDGFLFSGLRLTLRPMPWLEVGLSRGMQTGGTGRPRGAATFVKAFFGQELNQEVDDTFEDSSAQIAGWDVRVACPLAWASWLGSCAAYTQWMGEDAAGKLPLPYKFMSLWGVESTFEGGRYRGFAEWADTNAYSLPWDTNASFPGYVNGVYRQGYTQGARWAGSAQGSGSQVLTLGFMDAELQRMLKLHVGTVHKSIGAFSPAVDAPHGRLRGVAASQVFQWGHVTLTPELAWTHLSKGTDQAASKRHGVRLGLAARVPL